MSDDFFTHRLNLAEICTVPEKIISVYSLEKHVWADSNSEASRKARQPELKTVEEFQIDPVRPFLTDILRNMAAPWKRERKDNPVGQGYWIQAEFGSGKSHLLCCLAALALGRKEAWDIVKKKEDASGRGKRESLYRFWEEGIEAKGQRAKGKEEGIEAKGEGATGKGIFVIVKTLVGAGSGTVGLADKGRRLSEYVLDAAKEQIQAELGKNISLYPAELLTDRFIAEDQERYRKDPAKFLRDPRYFDEDEFVEADDFIRTIQQDKTPEYKRSCGNKLWRFYTEYLKVQPQIAAETEDILRHMAETILSEGYSGVLLVLDEVSLFMKNRDEDQRSDDEKTLVVLSNRLAKIHNLPVWTICAAQQAIESRMGVKNIIANDRLKLVKLLEEDKDYYDIVLARVREIKNPTAISSYYLYYKRGFTWPNSIGEADFRHFFPFHKPAIEVLRAITYELTTTRSAIHFMHQTLKQQIKNKGRELIRKYYHLFEPLPDFMQVIAFLDRIHGYLPGWEIPKLAPSSYSKDYGFITDYFCEIMHELRRIDLLGAIRPRFEVVDHARRTHGVSGRDQRAVMKITSGLLKLLHPDGRVTDEELQDILGLSCELRQRVRDQLHLIAPGEYDRISLGALMQPLGKQIVPDLPDSNRVQRVALPEKPSVGEVVGLAVEGDRGCILHFEMQATKGSGRIVPLGSIQRVMRESIEAAAQYIRAKHEDLGISAEWRKSFDVAVLATFMGVPKEGPSAGITIVTGIVSALKKVPVRNDLAMTGEITIMGRVLPVGGIQQKIRAAYDAGVKEVLLPADNLKEAEGLPSYLLDGIKLTPVSTIGEVIAMSLVNNTNGGTQNAPR